MTDTQILWALFALGIIGTVLTQIRRRSTTVPAWFRENAIGIATGIISGLTLFLIGAGDQSVAGSFMARTWAAGIGPLTMFVVGGNVITGKSNLRRKSQRVTDAIDNPVD